MMATRNLYESLVFVFIVIHRLIFVGWVPVDCGMYHQEIVILVGRKVYMRQSRVTQTHCLSVSKARKPKYPRG